MNKKDEEAFNAWVISEDNSEGLFSNMNSYTRDEYFAKAGFEAGAKHGRSQLNELRDDNMPELYKVIKKLQEENKKLVEALKFYADKNKSNSIFNPDYHDEEDCDFHEDTQFTHFGKLARQVLKEIGEE